MDSISYTPGLMSWAHAFLMAEAGTHVPCGSVIFPLSPPFLVYQKPLLAALGVAVCGLGRFSPLPSLLTFQPGLPPKCVFLVWNEIFTVRGPIYASQDTLSINHVACRCSPEYPVHSYDIRVLRVRSCEWHMGVALGVASPSLLRLTAIKLQAVLR